MPVPLRAARRLASFAPIALASVALAPLALAGAVPATAQVPAVPQTAAPAAAGTPDVPAPRHIQTGTPWLYEGSDVPRDPEWVFGVLPNGLRYAVRHNAVPAGQVSVRIRIDAGALYERPAELGYAHLLEHLLFRQSRDLGPAEAIPTWQRLGATFGSDTNAATSDTQTVFKLNLPGADLAKFDTSMKLLSGMVREPVLSDANVKAEVPIVLAERRERLGAPYRAMMASRATFFDGQPLGERDPIGTPETLNAATGAAVQAFHQRWYRPQNAVVVIAGDFDPQVMAGEVEKWFADWQGKGAVVPAPSFGDPVAPKGRSGGAAVGTVPLGRVEVLVEPDVPQTISYAVLRPWRPVQDTIVYNEGLLLDALSQRLINRRLEARARDGGSFLTARVGQEDISRSVDATFVTVTPLGKDWQAALKDVRAVIADALRAPPGADELAREVSEFALDFESGVEERDVLAGSKLADDIVNAVDIRETVAAPETVQTVFADMRDRITPAAVFAHTQALFDGTVSRALMIAPGDGGAAGTAALRTAMTTPVAPDPTARLATKTLSFDDLPAIGAPGTIAAQGQLGVLGIQRMQLSNGVNAVLWPNQAEPGRVQVRVRFGSGYRAFDADTAPYASLGEAALVGSGEAGLSQDDLDRISTGRKLGFDFEIEPAAFVLSAETRGADLADQLYLFAAKFARPQWDASPFERARASGRIGYDSYASTPSSVLNRDLAFLLNGSDPRFATPDPATLDRTTADRFRAVWAPLLAQGPIEVTVFGDFDPAQADAALARTFGALGPREPIPAAAQARTERFDARGGRPVVLHHRGEASQAAAVVAWPTGGGIADIAESRQLEILSQLFGNRLLDAMREKTGASYAPQVVNDWPTDLPSGGTITALAQLTPETVPVFFETANQIAADLAATPATADELERITEPLKQTISRASTSNTFWLYQLAGATEDPRKIAAIPGLLRDYVVTTPAAMQALAKKYLTREELKVAVLPEGQALAR